MRMVFKLLALGLALSGNAWAQEASSPVAGAPSAQSAPAEAPVPAPAAADTEVAAATRAQEFYDSLHRRTGMILVAQGKVRLEVPETHYFIAAADARRVIVELWQNPPSAADGIEGMIFEAGANPAAGAWGAVLAYSPEGYVSDSDASSTDYNELLRDMQQHTRDQNGERERHGYPAMTLEGWAEFPHYDAQTHKVYWAKELSVANDGGHGLNYDIRVLGRGGVFVVSFVAGMSELPSIRAAAPAVLAIPEFTAGNRYAEYQEGTDPKAAYGIAGLIAGGAAVAVAQKTGLIALLLAFGKKFVVLIIAGFVGLAGVVGRMFQRKPADG